MATIVPEVNATPFVDGVGVLLALARADPSLTGVNVFEDIPDHLMNYLPALVISRAGGASTNPSFHSSFFVHMQVWSDATSEYPNDTFKAAFELSRKVEQLYYAAWRRQTVALDEDGKPLGWIAKWRESSGFQRFTDPDLPHIGRYIGVYDLIIRNPRST